MGFFSHLFYPWGFVVKIAALVHFFWRRRASFVWRWIIFMGGFGGAAAVRNLESAFRAERKLYSCRGGLSLAAPYAATGRDSEAAAVFSSAMQLPSTPEMLCSYAAFLASQNRKEEAREWLNRLEET